VQVDIRGITPAKLHQRLPLFMGSPEDMAELMSYDDVQQLDGKTYAV
jgi:fructose-1,6-bisphosphatase I